MKTSAQEYLLDEFRTIDPSLMPAKLYDFFGYLQFFSTEPARHLLASNPMEIKFLNCHSQELILVNESAAKPATERVNWSVFELKNDRRIRRVGKITTCAKPFYVTGYFVRQEAQNTVIEGRKIRRRLTDCRIFTFKNDNVFMAYRSYEPTTPFFTNALFDFLRKIRKRFLKHARVFTNALILLARILKKFWSSSESNCPSLTKIPDVLANSVPTHCTVNNPCKLTLDIQFYFTNDAVDAIRLLEFADLPTNKAIEFYVNDRIEELNDASSSKSHLLVVNPIIVVEKIDSISPTTNTDVVWQELLRPGCSSALGAPQNWETVRKNRRKKNGTFYTAVVFFDPSRLAGSGQAKMYAECSEEALCVVRVGYESWSLAAHEFGHLLGMHHNDNTKTYAHAFPFEEGIEYQTIMGVKKNVVRLPIYSTLDTDVELKWNGKKVGGKKNNNQLVYDKNYERISTLN